MKKLITAVILATAMTGTLAGCGGGGGGTAAPAATGSAGTEQAASGAGSPQGSGTVVTATSAGGPTASAAPAAAGTAKMTWETPASADGTQAQSVAGYRVHYGTRSGTYTATVDVGKATACTVTNLAPGRYYFVVSAYDASGYESGYSNEASKDI